VRRSANVHPLASSWCRTAWTTARHTLCSSCLCLWLPEGSSWVEEPRIMKEYHSSLDSSIPGFIQGLRYTRPTTQICKYHMCRCAARKRAYCTLTALTTSWGTTTTILLHACAGWWQYARAGVHDDLVPPPLAYWTLCHAEQIDGGRHITPQLLVVDFSFALTHCLMFTFNQCSLTQYTNAASKFAKHETSTFPLTPDVLICRSVLARGLHTRTAVARLRNR